MKLKENSNLLMNNKPNIISDRFGRNHDYLRISLTERCNLRCFYCMPEEGIELRNRDVFMRQEEILAIAKSFTNLGVKKIRLTGGEPLVRKDAGEIIEGLSKLPVELGITTNGVLIDKYIDVFKRAKISSVNVSLDSLNRQRQAVISRRDYFDRIINNIDLLLDQGFEVKINGVIMRGVNDDEIIDFIEWTKDKPLHVRFIEFMPFDGNKWNWDKKVSYQEIMDKLSTYYPTHKILKIDDKPHDTTKNYKIEGHKGTFGIISTVTNPFCDSCNRIRLTADGKIKNCLFSSGETDLLTAYRNGEDLDALILNNVWHKKKLRGGITSFEDSELLHKNRSMVAIGG